ncbi:MAG: hypothetical protein K9H25_24240 [Rhodospirillum sp.]|nr:hypothetical protein [Rhodospirillum sp.]MCF8503236.1 hypothetical protein [Rhodospirillum sp.]
MTDDRNRNPKIRPDATGLEGLTGHLLKDLWGVTPDQFAVARGLPARCDGVRALLRMGRQEERRVDSGIGK